MISLIAAMAKNRVIGKSNQMPWHLPTDFKRFKQITLDHTVIMGRKTFESLKKPLVQRQNIVLSKNPEFQAAGCEVFTNLAAALDPLPKQIEHFIIGGEQIFKSSLASADKLYLSQIQTDMDGDIYFPTLDFNLFEMIFEQQVNEDKHPYSFTIWHKKTAFFT